MKLKNIFLSFYLFFSMCICAFASENNKNRNIESRYKTITYDVFGGIMYSAGFNKFEEISSSFMPTKTHSLFVFAGIDLYAGGYYDKIAKRYKEYLITPMFGIQFDYNIWNKSNNNDYFSLKNNFNLLVRLGVLFKLKFDTNAKLYFILGMAHNIFKNSDISYIMNIKTNEFKNKSTAICGVLVLALTLLLKNISCLVWNIEQYHFYQKILILDLTKLKCKTI